MEYDDTDEIVDFSFLEEKDSQEIFGLLDYYLKEGIHIQSTPSQCEFFYYIKKYKPFLIHYYKTIHKVNLESGGEGSQEYFYIDYNKEDGKPQIPSGNREPLSAEHIIIGFVIYKIIYIDRNVELESINKLKKLIDQEYEEYKPALIRLIAKKEVKKSIKKDSQIIEKAVEKAIEKFEKLGWFYRLNDKIEPLPSFHRLLKIYGESIGDIKEILKSYE